ncbi:hypothetical protein Lal_00026716 [Lupinus albus]|nr:hypothetical protein Lal_00026716 [Lupinus albus]
MWWDEKRDPKVGGGVGRIREVAKNRTPILTKVNRRMKYARSGALGALDFGFTIYNLGAYNKEITGNLLHVKSTGRSLRWTRRIPTYLISRAREDQELVWCIKLCKKKVNEVVENGAHTLNLEATEAQKDAHREIKKKDLHRRLRPVLLTRKRFLY